MTVHAITSLEQFKETIGQNQIVVLDATASWCGPCKAISPLFVKWSESDNFKDAALFAKFDIDDVPDLTQELAVRAMPTIMIFKDGEKVDEFTGANPGAIQNLITKYTS